jgi:tripeptide aminopeptidase
LIMNEELLSRFIRYVKINTASDEKSDSSPSTQNQFDLAKVLVDELRSFGLRATVDEHCYIYAAIQANTRVNAPVIGFTAHLDTSPEVSGANVKPQIVRNYDGGDIIINKDLGIIIKESENPDLKRCTGHTLVTSDGTTLLGADDKAGIAAIMTAAKTLVRNSDIPHGEIRIAFTPDEEVARGTDHFDLKAFGADFAYTVDGGFEGEINKETFSADQAIIEVEGRDIHPGAAKDIMVNAVRVISEIASKLPKEMSPEKTEKFQPFIHPVSIEGAVSKATLRLILRDFKTEGLISQKEVLEIIIKMAKENYPQANISLNITEQYRNMVNILEKYPVVTDRLVLAVQKTGITPVWKPIRGGTDGSRLTAMGLPTPNIFTGGSNYHSKTEWLSIEACEKAAETVVNIARVDL